MAEIVAALDEQGANDLLDTTIAGLGPQSASDSAGIGPFTAGYAVTATLANGDVDLIPPDIVRIVDLRLNWDIDFKLDIDLGAILPDICLPRVCIDIPCAGEVCTPTICLEWPSIPVHVSFGDFLKATGDFRLQISLAGNVWKVEAVVAGIPNLQFGAGTAGLLAAIGVAANLVLLPIPIFGLLAAIAVNAILVAIGIAGVTGFLGPILTPFVSGLRIALYEQPRLFELLPAESPVDPKVDFNIDLITASVTHNGAEDELVLVADISA